ncbi:hypothetical protein [Cellulomonas sp. 73-145]|nr:hypothetical protein [Cellulomonas sp. 73-145]
MSGVPGGECTYLVVGYPSVIPSRRSYPAFRSGPLLVMRRDF